jgi:hypothetical protein
VKDTILQIKKKEKDHCGHYNMPVDIVPSTNK